MSTTPASSPTQSDSLIALVASAAAGDASSQAQLFERYWPVIERAVRGRKSRMGRKLSMREDTQDLQQAAALKILTELDKHRWQGRSAFAAWVKKLAELEVVDAMRHHSAKKRDVGADQSLDSGNMQHSRRSPESRFDDQQRWEKLLVQVDSLKAEYGAALVMHHMGFSHAEIGETLDCTPEAARKLVSRARIRLLDLVDEP